MAKIFNSLLNKFFSVLLILLTSSVVFAAPNPALAQDLSLREVGDLVFYEGNGCTQDIVFTYNSEVAANDNCQTSGTACYGDNDEARSLLITGFAKPATRIKVYDSPSADTTDDYAVIDILPDLPPEGSCVSTFEQSTIRPGFRMSYVRKDGLDGKISHVTIQP
ncbi:MAG TPA: hypothetical protein VK203_15770 [Nostocaceae cyanobacterium]|nr:hypothetical protein [Nostocaceae cyanobacterium]